MLMINFPSGWGGGFQRVCHGHQHAYWRLSCGETALVIQALWQRQRWSHHKGGNARHNAGVYGSFSSLIDKVRSHVWVYASSCLQAVYKMSVSAALTTPNPLTAEECTNRIFVRLDKDNDSEERCFAHLLNYLVWHSPPSNYDFHDKAKLLMQTMEKKTYFTS